MAMSIRDLVIVSNSLRNRADKFSNRAKNLERDIIAIRITKVTNYNYPKKGDINPNVKTTFRVRVRTKHTTYKHKHPIAGGDYHFPENHTHNTEVHVDSLSVDVPCKVHCNCPDFHFRFAYPLFKRDAFFGNKNKWNKVPTKVTNPNYTPAVCKHILGVFRVLIKLKRFSAPVYSEYIRNFKASEVMSPIQKG